jgi:hypothetical protein
MLGEAATLKNCNLGEVIPDLHTHHVATQGAAITLATAATLNYVCIGTL